MYLMYVDESGDSGLVNSPTRYFVLSGLVLHELRWKEYLDELVAFRRRMRDTYGMHLREEIHAAVMIQRPGELSRIRRNDRLAILRHFADTLAALSDLNVINIVVDKNNKPPEYDVFEAAWRALIQRFDNTLTHRNFNGPANPDERGILFPDRTEDKKLKTLLRRMRRYNPVPHRRDLGSGYRDMPLERIVEDPNFRESDDSFFIQAADLIAWSVYQYLDPCNYVRRKGARNYLLRLDPILCKVASRTDPLGLVRL